MEMVACICLLSYLSCDCPTCKSLYIKHDYFFIIVGISGNHLFFMLHELRYVCVLPFKTARFKHILFMTEHEKGLSRAKKLCLAVSITNTHICTYYRLRVLIRNVFVNFRVLHFGCSYAHDCGMLQILS